MKIKIFDPIYGVPITFLEKYCPEQFDIVAFRKGEDGKDLTFTRQEELTFNNSVELGGAVTPYFRVLVKKNRLI